MADATQYVMKLEEVISLIIKNLDIHDGKWGLLLGYQIGVGAFGATPDQQFPGASVAIGNLGIQRLEPGAMMVGPIVDAAEVNPLEVSHKKKSQ